MRIEFDSLKEIKEFILMVDIYQWTDQERPWGGKGYIITDRYHHPEALEKEEGFIMVSRPEDSRVIKQSDTVIVTPYVKQLSWLFKTLYFLTMEHKLDVLSFDTGFMVACEGYFIMNPGHSAKELMIYILDAIQRMEDANRARRSDEEACGRK